MAGAPQMDAAFGRLDHSVPEGGNDTGNPSTDHSAIIRAAAAEAVRGEEAQTPFVEPGSQFHEGRPTPIQEPEPQVDEHGLEIVPQEQQEGQQQQQQQTPSQEEGIRLPPPDFEQLNRTFGIHTPEDFDTAPPAVQDAYSAMAQQLQDTFEAQQQALREATNADLRIKGFTERLNDPEGQRRILLSMASESPEVFQETLQVFERMQEDPEYRDAVTARIKAEVQLEAAQRAQQAAVASQQMSRGQQVEARTERLAQRLGVDVEWAKEQVVGRILANQARTGEANITFQEVDQLIGDIARRTGAKPQPVRTPEAQQQQKQAPQQVASDAGKTPPPQQQESRPQPTPSSRPGEQGQNAMDALRSAVKQSSDRVRGMGL